MEKGINWDDKAEVHKRLCDKYNVSPDQCKRQYRMQLIELLDISNMQAKIAILNKETCNVSGYALSGIWTCCIV